MQRFHESMSPALYQVETGNYYNALIQVNESFKILLYDESDEEVILDAAMFKSLVNAFKVTQCIVDLPEIELTEHIQQVLEATQTAIEEYLQDRITVEYFWEQIVGLARLVHYISGVANYLEENDMSLGQSDNPAVSIVLDKDGAIQMYGLLSEDGGLNFEQASELQDEFINSLAEEGTTADQLVNLAGRLLTNQKFTEAIKTYEAIMIRFPSETPQCLNAMGACYFYLDEFETAINYYLKAYESGEMRDTIEYNVWESCDALIKQSGEKNEKMKWKFFYEEHFPNTSRSFEIS